MCVCVCVWLLTFVPCSHFGLVLQRSKHAGSRSSSSSKVHPSFSLHPQMNTREREIPLCVSDPQQTQTDTCAHFQLRFPTSLLPLLWHRLQQKAPVSLRACVRRLLQSAQTSSSSSSSRKQSKRKHKLPLHKVRPCVLAALLCFLKYPPPSPAATMHCGLDCNVQHLIPFLPPNFPAQQNKREQKCLLTILFQVRACWSQC